VGHPVTDVGTEREKYLLHRISNLQPGM
jgi:hypothetical protein